MYTVYYNVFMNCITSFIDFYKTGVANALTFYYNSSFPFEGSSGSDIFSRINPILSLIFV